MIVLLGHLLGLGTPMPVQPIARDSVVEAVIIELQIGRLNTRTVQAYRLGVDALIPLGTFFDLVEIKADWQPSVWRNKIMNPRSKDCSIQEHSL